MLCKDTEGGRVKQKFMNIATYKKKKNISNKIVVDTVVTPLAAKQVNKK